ncbi:Glycosyl transferase [Aphelenchoides avenae]|nr:Glycosyl transferase [Aphelenchus avenae]
MHVPPSQLFHIQFLNEHYLYNMSTPSDPAVCDNVTLFIGVQNRPGSVDKRNSIRSSWGAEMPNNAIVRFFVGRTDNVTYRKLEEEQRRFGDIVFYDLPEGYNKLHLKASQGRSLQSLKQRRKVPRSVALFLVHAMMQWQQTFCAQAAFWLKTDDDATVHVARLLHHIERRFKPAMNGTVEVFCAVNYPLPVLRDQSSKWYIPREVYPHDYYPACCSGFSYMVSRDAVAAILFGTRFVNAFGIEDALYTGVIAANMGISRTTHPDVFRYVGSVPNATKCDDAGVPLLSAIFAERADPSRRQADALSDLKNQTCA